MDDLAHSLRCTWRSLTDLQSLVLTGKLDGTPGAVKPSLSQGTSQLQQELLKRGITDVSPPKRDLLCELNSILRGVQHVPTLLISNPSQCLAEMGLEPEAPEHKKEEEGSFRCVKCIAKEKKKKNCVSNYYS